MRSDMLLPMLKKSNIDKPLPKRAMPLTKCLHQAACNALVHSCCTGGFDGACDYRFVWVEQATTTVGVGSRLEKWKPLKSADVVLCAVCVRAELRDPFLDWSDIR